MAFNEIRLTWLEDAINKMVVMIWVQATVGQHVNCAGGENKTDEDI